MALLALVAVLLLCPSIAPAAIGTVKTVVVLIPGNTQGSPGASTLISQGLRTAFAAGSREDLQLRFEALDLSRFPGMGGRELLAHYLRQKYADQTIELVVAILASALDFALEYRETLFPGVPLVFAALDEEEVRTRTIPADVIGVPVEKDLVGTLEFALRLQPEIQRVFVVVGRSSFDARWEAVARQRFRPYENRLEFNYLSGLPMDELLKTVANLPGRSIVQYLHVFEDAAGRTFIPVEALSLVAAKANAPVYSQVDSYMGRGIVGGRLMSYELAGKNAASLGLRILAGERPETISGLGVSPNAYVVDWRQLRRWGLPPRALPPGTDVRYRAPSTWDLYRRPIVGAIGLFVLQTVLIVALLLHRRHRRKAEQDLRLSQVELRRLTGRLLQAQEIESRRIARELHDDLGQRLALLTVEMDLLRQKLPEATDMHELLRQTRQLSSSVHDLSHQLHPAKLEQLGLAAAIKGLCRELTDHHGLKIEFTETQFPPAISPEAGLCLYRLAQEALTNAAKHSGAEHVRVELSGTANMMFLRVVDDGRGFAPEQIQGRDGLGLVSMRERVSHLGGEIAIDSLPGGGTRVHARVPLTASTPAV